MLENSNLLEGKVAKEVETLINEYEDIKAKANDLETSKKKVLARLFELAPVGTNETGNIVFNVTLNSGRVSIAPKKLQEQAPDLFKKISDMGLVNKGDDFLTITGVKHKGDRA